MELPTQLLLLKIEEANLYLDKQSLEKTTNKRKPKYKLARSKILEQYLFHILTKRKSACIKSLTLKIKRDDWHNIVDNNYLKEDLSYCDVTKYALHDKALLLEKIKDPLNGFPFIAKLSLAKYEKLLKLCEKVKHVPKVSDAAKEIINLSLKLDEKLKQLNLD